MVVLLYHYKKPLLELLYLRVKYYRKLFHNHVTCYFMTLRRGKEKSAILMHLSWEKEVGVVIFKRC